MKYNVAMKPIVIEIEIDAPIERVFSTFTDVQGWPEIIKTMTKIELLTDGPVGLGTRFRETRLVCKKAVHEEMEFKVFEPPTRYVLEATSHSTHYISTFNFSDQAGSTALQMSFAAKHQTFVAKTIGGFLLFFLRGMTKRMLTADLNATKQAIESSSQ